LGTLQVQARALGDPTRHRIFRYLAEATDPVDVPELTGHFELNHNAIRQHLAKLVDAGLVSEAKAPSRGRGRPRLVYAVDPSADSRWGVRGPYERLTLLLIEMLRTGNSALEVGRRAGSQLPVGKGEADDPVALVTGAMQRHGFDPIVRDNGDQIELVLRACPFETAALAEPEIVCAIHLGLTAGLAELTGGRAVVNGLVPNDPRRANCVLTLHPAEPDHAGEPGVR
jgi:predicted ArsR family transcriptional regulator